MKKWIIRSIMLLLIIGGLLAYKLYNDIFTPNVDLDAPTSIIYIPTGAKIKDVIDTLSNRSLIKDTSSFSWVAQKMKFTSPKPGKYKISNAWSNKQLVGHLRSGKQEPVKLTFNNVRTIDELCSVFSKNLEGRKQDFLSLASSQEFQSKLGLTNETIISLFIPNTYDVYWNSSPEKLFEKLSREHKIFWNSKRLKAIKQKEMTESEAYTLASIVQKESNLNSEKPRLAGVYLNRLKKGILLQADPTVVFAVGDFEIRRVLNKHLEYDSPYNTYKYAGLPPGPICMPDVSSLDAVIYAEEHDFLYFCANTENNGSHLFAKTLKQHNRNAAKFHRWLNKQNIYK